MVLLGGVLSLMSEIPLYPMGHMGTFLEPLCGSCTWPRVELRGPALRLEHREEAAWTLVPQQVREQLVDGLWFRI